VEAPERLPLLLRIPHWSAQTEIRVNREAAPMPVPGQYLAIDREWRSGDTIELALNMGLRVWAGERECEGKASLFRGPLLLAYDPRFDSLDPRQLPTFDPTRLQMIDAPWRLPPRPLLLHGLSAADGRQVVLCDFASAGAAGAPYVSWLPVQGATPQPFTRTNPSRTRKIG